MLQQGSLVELGREVSVSVSSLHSVVCFCDIFLITLKAYHGLAPRYISELLIPYGETQPELFGQVPLSSSNVQNED